MPFSQRSVVEESVESVAERAEVRHLELPCFVHQDVPAEVIAAKVYEALTLPSPKVRYTLTPDPVRLAMAAVLPKRTFDRIIAKRLGLMPRA